MAVYCAGASQDIRVASALGLVNAGSCTVEYWVKINSQVGTNGVFSFSFWAFNSKNIENTVEYRDESGTKNIRFIRTKVSVADQNFNYQVTLPVGQWNHVAYTYDGVNVTGYFNGVQQAQGAASGDGNAGANPTDGFNINSQERVGGSPAAFGDCTYDEVRAWSGIARTQAEISTNMWRRIPAEPSTNMKLIWRLNETGATTANDLLQSNNGTIRGGAAFADSAPIFYPG